MAELARHARGGRPHREQGRPLRAHAAGHPPHRPERAQRPVQEARHATSMGRHELERTGVGHERDYDTKPYEFGDPFNLHIERTVRNAIRRTGGGTPVRSRPDDFEVERTEQLVRSSHRADARPVAVDADARQLPAGQEGGDGAALADLEPVPARLPRHRRLQRGGPRAQGRAAARGVVGLRLRHQHAARLPCSAAGCWPARPAPSRSS